MSMEKFDFKGNAVRVLGTQEAPVFVLNDVAKVLGISNVGNVVARLNEADIRRMDVRSGGQNRNMVVVNESGLYDVVFQSNKPEAKEFRRWVTNEVLPSIRKHGAYMTEQTLERALNEPDFLIQLATKLKEEQEKRKQAEEESQLMSQRLQVIEGTTGIIPGTFWTLAYGAKGKNIFIRKLRQMGFLYKQSQRLTMQGEATNLLRNWNRPIPDTDRTTMTAVVIPGKEWEFFQFVESTPELSGAFDPVVNSREELEARVEMVRNGGSL